MAHIRPLELPEDIRNETFRKSEVIFYDYAKKLPKDWFVLYGVTWYLKIRNNSWSEGEADFVIVSPETGLVVVEIKGGAIGRDDNGWYSIDRYNEVHRIKDPALQAANCKHNLVRYIKEHPEFKSRTIPARHMVCFPNVSNKDSTRLIELPREMQILSEDLENLQKVIQDFSQRNYDAVGSSIEKLTQLECCKIADILKPSFEYPNRWSTQAKKQNEIMNSLTKEQEYLWEIMSENDRISLSGPAGSGKTILALKLIKSVIESGGTAIAIVPTIALKNFYLSAINSDQLNVFCYDISNFELATKTYATLFIIDEAQDISDDLWLSLYEYFQIESAKKLLCVFDSNQRLRKSGTICPMENLISLRLTKVLRNTKQIGDFSTSFFTDKKPCSVVGPDGINVQYTTLKETTDIVDEVVNIIAKYVEIEGFDYSDIVVLFADDTKTRFKKEGNKKRNRLGVSFRGSRAFDRSYVHKSPIVLVETVFVFRGLESKVVILAGLDDIKGDIKENACYIGASRARNILHILAKRSTIKDIKKHIEQ